MTQHTSPNPASHSNGASPGNEAILNEAPHSEPEPAPESESGSDCAAEEWDEEPQWRKGREQRANPGPALKGLTQDQITRRHIRMVNELVELTHPLASEYLTMAHEVSPAAQGWERLVNTGCKLSGMTKQLMIAARDLAGNG